MCANEVRLSYLGNFTVMKVIMYVQLNLKIRLGTGLATWHFVVETKKLALNVLFGDSFYIFGIDLVFGSITKEPK